MDQVATSFKNFNLRLLKNALDEKKFDKEVLFIRMYICVNVYTNICMRACVRRHVGVIIHSGYSRYCFLMQKPISTVHETNKFDLKQKHIFTDCSLFTFSKYDKILYKAMLSYHTA